MEPWLQETTAGLASSVSAEPQAPGLARASIPPRVSPAGGVTRSSAAGKGKFGAVRCSLTSPSAVCSAPGCCGAGPPVFSMAVDWLGFGYAALVASGGLIGYAKAGSVPSLAAGLFFGSLAGLGAYQLSQNPNNVWISLITSGTLTAIMGTRFYNSGKFMPAGLIAGVSLLMVGRLALKMMEKPHDK
ncbi:transmembrane protein 14C-like isoform X4 [Grus americana]|uniref:transmembrane protein 14C-like isoform X4 n=1 Tax=Grus americana TaxID=9117 RepID=UPI002407D081|nr:transmembrane protein 14C-like isoform X4 [Grus americana]